MSYRFLAIVICPLFSIVAPHASKIPLTVKKISLMLRTGYSNDAVVQDLANRHFADSIDENKETALLRAGASLELVDVLKHGTYSLPPEKASEVKAELEEQAKRRALQAAEERKLNTLYQDRIARERQTASKVASAENISKFLKGSLVHYHNGSIIQADDEALANKKLIAFYFSAHWCAPCRKFTPQLVDYYNQVAREHPEFEIVFFSLDKTGSAMESYMREANMPWPAIDYQKVQEKEALRKNAGGDGIPSLVVVDPSGRVISSTYAGGQYLGPQKVLGDLNTIFGGKTASRQ